MEPKRSLVALAKGENRIEAIAQAFDLLGGIKRWIKPGDRVLLKPSVLMVGGTPLLTHIDMMKGLFLLAREAGAGEILVGETCASNLSPRVQFEYLGYADALKRLGIKLVFFDEDEWVRISRPQNFCLKDLHLPRTLVDADVWITVPVAKTHVATLTTLGIKNSHGILMDVDKARHHCHRPALGSSLHDKLVDVLAVVKPHLTVIDMFHAMEGNGPGLGDTVEMKIVVASDDVVAADAVGDYLMGSRNLENPLPRKAQERGLGIADLDRIDIVGEKPDDHRRCFSRPLPGEIPDYDPPGLKILRGNACLSGCGMAARFLIEIFRLLLGKDLSELQPIHVLVGLNPPPPPEKKFILVYGDCAMYSTWNYEYRKNPAWIGPWWRKRPGYIQIPGCMPLNLDWFQTLAKMMKGYAPLLSFTSIVELALAERFNQATGVPLEKNPRRWHFDPDFAREYAREIAESKPPEYLYLNDSRKKTEAKKNSLP